MPEEDWILRIMEKSRGAGAQDMPSSTAETENDIENETDVLLQGGRGAQPEVLPPAARGGSQPAGRPLLGGQHPKAEGGAASTSEKDVSFDGRYIMYGPPTCTQHT